MTSDPSTQHDRDELFVADFYPLLGEYLAARHAAGYDAETGQARFLGWLDEHAAVRGADEAVLAAGEDDLPVARAADPAAQAADPGTRAADPATRAADPGADPVEEYLKQVGKIPALSAEQETELARRIEAGLFAEEKLACDGRALPADARLELERMAGDGERAKNQLLEANLRLVVSLASRFTGRGMPFLDLVQEGNLGLIQAVEKFDHTKGYRFSTYATWWIRQAIIRTLAIPARTIRIPVHLVELVNQLGRAQRRLRHDLGREPTAEELASELDVTPAQVMAAQRYLREPVSPPPPDGDSAVGGEP